MPNMLHKKFGIPSILGGQKCLRRFEELSQKKSAYARRQTLGDIETQPSNILPNNSWIPAQNLCRNDG